MNQIIRKAGSQKSIKGPEDWFTGDVLITPLFPTQEGSNVSGAQVTFQPGARSAWHTHPMGQNLIVISGIGWTQCEGGPKIEIHPGDVVSCPCGKKHWHGATKDSEFSHIYISKPESKLTQLED